MVTAFFGFADPNAKREMLAKRIVELQSAVKGQRGAAKIAKAAERVRSAALTVVKAARSFVLAQPAMMTGENWDKDGERLSLQLANCDREFERWSSLSTDRIVEQFGAAPPDDLKEGFAE